MSVAVPIAVILTVQLLFAAVVAAEYPLNTQRTERNSR